MGSGVSFFLFAFDWFWRAAVSGFGVWKMVLRAKIGICEGFCKAPHEYIIVCLALWNLSQRILMQLYWRVLLKSSSVCGVGAEWLRSHAYSRICVCIYIHIYTYTEANTFVFVYAVLYLFDTYWYIFVRRRTETYAYRFFLRCERRSCFGTADWD